MAERVCCLYRVSTIKQVDHDDQNQADIPVQRKSCREFAEKMGWTVVFEEQETGVSGFKVSANDRDKIQLIKEHAEKGLFDVLLVFMFDRIGRRAEETPFVVEWFVKHGIQVWSVNEGEQRIDSHADRLMNYIRFWQADGESQKTAIRTKTALAQMVQEGRFRGGVAPYGYKLVPSGTYNKRKHEVNKLAIEEAEARVVRTIFNLCVGSGYGRCKIATFLNEKGQFTRDNENWHEATVGHILHNVMYKGILRSGDTQSEIFEKLQIIDPTTFELAQQLMEQRVNDYNDQRTMPRNISGQSLLSGNVFCGDCGGRLTLTTNGTYTANANGEKVHRVRVRYVCYNKTRKRKKCNGPTGYTMHVLDDMITDVLHRIFDRMKAASRDDLIQRTHKNALLELEQRLTKAKTECGKAAKEYESLKAEVIKAVQGKSKFKMDLLSELVDAASEKMLSANELLRKLTMESDERNQKLTAIQADFERILGWSEIFDSSDMAVKKMIAGYIIKRVHVYAGYKLKIEFSISMEQFRDGLDIVSEQLLMEHAS